MIPTGMLITRYSKLSSKIQVTTVLQLQVIIMRAVMLRDDGGARRTHTDTQIFWERANMTGPVCQNFRLTHYIDKCIYYGVYSSRKCTSTTNHTW